MPVVSTGNFMRQKPASSSPTTHLIKFIARLNARHSIVVNVIPDKKGGDHLREQME